MKLGAPIELQALAVWLVDVHPYKQGSCDLGAMSIHDFCRGIYAARVTLNLLAADKELKALFERKLLEQQRARAETVA